MAFEMSDKWKEKANMQIASSKQLWVINSTMNVFPHFKESVDITFPLSMLEASDIITKLKELEKEVKAK